MAVENLINLVTDRFNPDAIEALKSNLGIDAFSGQSTSTADMTGAGWLCVAALNTIKDASITFDEDEIKSTLKDILDSKDSAGIVLKQQTNSKGDNILMQLLNYYINSTTVSLSDIFDLMTYLFEDEGEIENLLKSVNSMGYSGAMIISYTENFIKDRGDICSKYASAFVDLSYPNNPNLLPIARLMVKAVSNPDIKDEALGAINEIVSAAIEDVDTGTYDKFEKVFFPFPYTTSEQADNSIVEYVYSIGTELLKGDISNSNSVLESVLSMVLETSGDSLAVIVGSIDPSKCIGLRYGETGFSLNTYKANVIPFDPRIDVCFHMVNRLGSSTPNGDIYKHFAPYLFPVPDGMPIEGYTLVGKMSETIAIDSDNKTLIEGDIIDVLKPLLSDASSQAANIAQDDELKRFFVLNAILGTCRDFTDNATMNLYSPINIILNTINKAHKAWVTANNATFDDYKSTYEDIISKLFGDTSCLGFDTAYKYWCNEYDKSF